MATIAEIKTQIESMLATLVSDAVAAGIAVEHDTYAFKRKNAHEPVANTSAGLRAFWFKGLSVTDGALAAGSAGNHLVRRMHLYVQYPDNLRNLEETIDVDREIVRNRMHNTALYGWPESELLHVQHESADEINRDNKTLIRHTIVVQYLSEPNVDRI